MHLARSSSFLSWRFLFHHVAIVTDVPRTPRPTLPSETQSEALSFDLNERRALSSLLLPDPLRRLEQGPLYVGSAGLVDNIDENHQLGAIKARFQTLISETSVLGPRPVKLNSLQKAHLEFWISLLDDRVTQHEYSSVLICAMAILEVKVADCLNTSDHHPILSTMIKVRRIFVV